MMIDLVGASSHSELSVRLLRDQKPEEPQCIYISSWEESVVEEENPIGQGVYSKISYFVFVYSGMHALSFSKL